MLPMCISNFKLIEAVLCLAKTVKEWTIVMYLLKIAFILFKTTEKICSDDVYYQF